MIGTNDNDSPMRICVFRGPKISSHRRENCQDMWILSSRFSMFFQKFPVKHQINGGFLEETRPSVHHFHHLKALIFTKAPGRHRGLPRSMAGCGTWRDYQPDMSGVPRHRAWTFGVIPGPEASRRMRRWGDQSRFSPLSSISMKQG